MGCGCNQHGQCEKHSEEFWFGVFDSLSPETIARLDRELLPPCPPPRPAGAPAAEAHTPDDAR
jgi:hypothetical protein